MYKFNKRIIDIIFSLFVLLFFIPIAFFLIIFFILIGRKKIFFSQKRYGYKKKIFNIYKFATIEYDKWNSKYKKTTYYKYGQFLRKTKIDEIPNFINVFIGDMSFIGPRPILIKYCNTQKKNDIFNARFEVKPGIIGLAQVNRINHKNNKKRIILDAYYAQNYNFILDLKIFLKFLKII